MTEFDLRLDPIRARLVSGAYGRVVLTANHPSITAEAVAKLELAPDDIVVQFNKAPAFNLFAEIASHKTHVLNANGDGGYWGLSTAGEPEPDVRRQSHGELTVFFTRWLSDAAKTFIAGLDGALSGGVIADQWQAPLYPYPRDRLPSAGFMAVNYFREVNALRLLLKRKPLPLVLFGFSGNYPPGQAWSQHDFAYEQLVYQTLVDITRVKPNGFPV